MIRNLARLLLAALSFTVTLAIAQPYPNKPVKIIVPYPAGQATDIVARLLAEGLTKMWGMQVVVENKGGGAAIPGMVAGKDAPADGYTMLMATSAAVAVSPGLYEKLPYDALRDYEMVVNVFRNPLLIVVNANAPYKTLKELVDYAKKNPGKVNWGYPGIGTTQHLTGELFKFRAGVDIVGIQYKGSAASTTDLLGNQIPAAVDSVPATLPHIQSGKIIALAMTTGKRVPMLPDVATVAELGYPEFEGSGWGGVAVPKGTPPAIVDKIAADIMKLLADPATQKAFTERGLLIEPIASKEWTPYVKAEIAKWGEVIRRANVKVE